jgi:SPP1 gp7 family putative phage head morphogenesis protein
MGVRKELDLLLKDSEKAVLDVMQSNLAFIGDNIINKVVAKESGLSNAKKLDAIKGIDASGLNEYKDDLLDVLTIIAYETLRQTKKEVPKAKYELSEKDIYSIQFVESKTVKKATKKVKKSNKRIETMWKKLPAKIRRRLKTQQELLVKTQLSDLEKAIYFQYTTSVGQEKAINQVKKDMQDNAEDFIEGPSVRAGAPLTAHQAIGEARNAFFTDPEVDKEISAFEFVNSYTQDRTPICTELNGTIFAKDDPNMMKFTPPLHWNCRSMILPILVGDLKGRKIEKLKIKKSNEKYLQFSEKLEAFILSHQMSDQGIL